MEYVLAYKMVGIFDNCYPEKSIGSFPGQPGPRRTGAPQLGRTGSSWDAPPFGALGVKGARGPVARDHRLVARLVLSRGSQLERDVHLRVGDRRGSSQVGQLHRSLLQAS